MKNKFVIVCLIIHKIVNQYKAYAEEEDLEQEGYLGLSAAVDHYNPDEGVAFLHYASFWIKQYMSRYIKSNGTIRLPEFMQGRIREYHRMVQKWQQNYHRKPTDGEICHFLGLNWEIVREPTESGSNGTNWKPGCACG